MDQALPNLKEKKKFKKKKDSEIIAHIDSERDYHFAIPQPASQLKDKPIYD